MEQTTEELDHHSEGTGASITDQDHLQEIDVHNHKTATIRDSMTKTTLGDKRVNNTTTDRGDPIPQEPEKEHPSQKT